MEFKHIFWFVGFYWSKILNLTAYRIKSIHWKYHISLFVHQETKKQGQNYCSEKGKAFTLSIGWKYCELFPEGLILDLMLSGETFNSFGTVGIAKYEHIRTDFTAKTVTLGAKLLVNVQIIPQNVDCALFFPPKVVYTKDI